MHTTQIAAEHIATIQRQINAIDSYAKSNPLNDAQKRTMATRRKIYVEILHSAQLVYDSALNDLKELAAINKARQIDKLAQKLKDTRINTAGLEEFKRQYKAGKLPKIMDLNKWGML